MEQVGWILCTILLFLSRLSLPAAKENTDIAQDNFTTAVMGTRSMSSNSTTNSTTISTTTTTNRPTTEVNTTFLEKQSTVNTFTSVTATMPNPNTEIITPENVSSHQSSASVSEPATVTRMLTTNHKSTANQVSTSDVQTSNTEAVRLTSLVTTEKHVNLAPAFNTEPMTSQDVLTTGHYLQTTSQGDLTSVRLHISTSPMGDLSPPPEPRLTSTKSQTDGLTAAPLVPSIATAPQTTSSWATSPANTHRSTTMVGVVATPTPSLSWVIIVALLSGVVIVGVLYFVCLIVRRKRRSRTKYLGSSFHSGKVSKRKKGAEQDPWAGPVKLGAGPGEECEGGEEDLGPDDKKEGGGAEVVLSTFTANKEENSGPDGGVGMAGSRESKKWEEEEPLLYIDEGAVDELERVSPEKDLKGNGHLLSDNDKIEQNGGAAFCLTTAV